MLKHSIFLFAAIAALTFFSGCTETGGGDDKPIDKTMSFTGFSPTKAVAGAALTLSGANFNTEAGATTVLINGVEAVIQSITSSEIVVTVPSGKCSGTIEVIAGDNKLSSADEFLFQSTHMVYIAGNEGVDASEVAAYWVDGVKKSIPGVTGRSSANAIYADAQGVIYIAGKKFVDNVAYAVCWKINGETVETTTLTDGSGHGQATSLCLVGNDVHVVGNQLRHVDKEIRRVSHAGQPDEIIMFHGSLNVAKYWKNGVLVKDLTDPMAKPKVTESGFATSIAVVNNNIFICGIEGKTTKYWKNGELIVDLTDGVHDAEARSIFVTRNEDVYIAGYEESMRHANARAQYWNQEGTVSPITTGNNFSSANSIFVVGKSVYVAYEETGSDENEFLRGKVWRNGTSKTISDVSKDTYVTSIYVAGGDVYVSGQEYGGSCHIAKYWKNDTVITLGDGVKDSFANSIYVREI